MHLYSAFRAISCAAGLLASYSDRTPTYPQVSKAEQIRRLLLKSLKPRDLDRSASKLFQRIDRIGADSGQFYIDDGTQSGWLSRVAYARREWVIIVRSDADNDVIPWNGYWLGARGNTLLVTSLPAGPDDMIGPIVGQWRRQGKYVVGAGIDLAAHSPSWADGDFLVFTVGRAGLVLHQRGGLEFATTLRFRSNRSEDLVGYDRQGSLQTIKGRREQGTERTRWKFHDGKYRKVSVRLVQDELWALDRLVTAVRYRRYSLLKQMVPKGTSRRWLVNTIWQYIRLDQLLCNYRAGDRFISLWRDADPLPPFQLYFSQRNGVWVVDKITKRRDD
jgi:hypothetical protein